MTSGSAADRIAQQRQRIADEAGVFAARINYTLKQVLQVEHDLVHAVAASRLVRVTTQDQAGIPLLVSGNDVFRLKIQYNCELSESKAFLAVDKSSFKLFHKDTAEPILTFDYLRKPTSNIPTAHINFHTESPGLALAVQDSGEVRRGRQRGRRFSQLHIPVGGHRFRPCLEDVLEMTIVEFGIDACPDWSADLKSGRGMWRELQLKAAVQDHPRAAVEALEGLGYSVDWPHDKPQPEWRLSKIEGY